MLSTQAIPTSFNTQKKSVDCRDKRKIKGKTLKLMEEKENNMAKALGTTRY